MKDTKNEILNILRSLNIPGIEELLQAMDDGGFYDSPCSTRYHLATPGGLAKHSLNVFDTMLVLNRALDAGLGYDDIAIVALLHDLGKMGDYSKRNYVEAPLLKNGKAPAAPYIHNPELTFEEHEIRSVIIANRYINITEEQTRAILHHNGMYGKLDNSYKAYYDKDKLSFLLHMADMYCSRFVEVDEYAEG